MIIFEAPSREKQTGQHNHSKHFFYLQNNSRIDIQRTETSYGDESAIV